MRSREEIQRDVTTMQVRIGGDAYRLILEVLLDIREAIAPQPEKPFLCPVPHCFATSPHIPHTHRHRQ